MMDKKKEENISLDAEFKETDELLKEFEDLGKEKLKEKIIEKAAIESTKVKTKPQIGVKLNFLYDEKSKCVFIGRKISVFKEFKDKGALFIGRVAEKEFQDWNILLDSLNPHVIFICGARGSGKSYLLGVIAEEIAKKNKNIGSIVIDPIGVFWSMRYANKESNEVSALAKWNLQPEGLKNIKVFVPKGYANKIPKNTYDGIFSVKPSMLNAEDWCLTFGIERFSPSGLLLEKVLRKVKRGFTTINKEKISPKKENFSLDDLIFCLENDVEINSKERGFKPDSIRALVSRLDAAKSWGIFDKKGTPLCELSKEGQLTIIDTSFLDDRVTALVVGLLARRILAARKIASRKTAAQKMKEFNVEELLEIDIPPTWLFIDEAHTLVPSGNIKTPASNALIEYVKQGRRPGCSIVLATQQPSAIDTKVLSQLDIIFTHKLVFNDDIKAVMKRMPTIVPEPYRKSNFIKTLPVGVALVGDRREETSRAFIMKVRPRKSQHEGRDLVALKEETKISEKEAKKLIKKFILNKLEQESELSKDEIESYLKSLNEKYKSKLSMEELLDYLKSKAEIEEEKVVLKGIKKEVTEEKAIIPSSEGFLEEPELLAFPCRVKNIDEIAEKFRKKKIFIFGKNESIDEINLKYRIIWKVEFEYMQPNNEFFAGLCFIDSATGEFVHFKNNTFVESKGLPKLKELGKKELEVLRALSKKKKDIEEIIRLCNLSREETAKALKNLVKLNFIEEIVDKEKIYYRLAEKIDLPPSAKEELLESIKILPFVKAEALEIDKIIYSKDDVIKLLSLLWPKVIVKRISSIYWPLFYITYRDEKSGERKILIDAFTGRKVGERRNGN